MHRIHHTIRLMGRVEYGSEAPPVPVGNLLRLIGPAVRQSILMGFLGRSRPPGRRPAWARFCIGYSVRWHRRGSRGRDDPVLRGPEAWRVADEMSGSRSSGGQDRPPKTWDSTSSATFWVTCPRHKTDSDRFDSPLLKRISSLGGAFGRDYQRAVFVGDRSTEEHPAVLDEVTIANAQ